MKHQAATQQPNTKHTGGMMKLNICLQWILVPNGGERVTNRKNRKREKDTQHERWLAITFVLYGYLF